MASRMLLSDVRHLARDLPKHIDNLKLALLSGAKSSNLYDKKHPQYLTKYHVYNLFVNM